MKTRILIFILVGLHIMGCSESKVAEKTLATNENKQTMGVKRNYCDGPFGQIHYRSAIPTAEAISKPPLMALHLSPNSSQVFSSFLPLIGQDRKVVAPDYPGYGMSDPILGEQKISDYAKAMLAVIEEVNLETPIDLIGYHTGTAVALEMARQRPDVIGSIVLVAIPVLTKEERAAGAALPRIPFDTIGEFARAEWQSSWKWRGPGQTAASVFGTFSAKMRPGARELGAKAILAYDLAPVLAEIKHELLLVRVKDDLWEASARAKELRPESEYIELPEYGHGLFHVVPAKMDSIVRNFLD